MVLNNIPVHDGRLFTWCRSGGDVTGTTERSDLNPGPMATRIYDDACDVGFFIKSPRTGVSMLFSLVAQEPSRDGDIERWVFRSSNGIVVTVYND